MKYAACYIIKISLNRRFGYYDIKLENYLKSSHYDITDIKKALPLTLYEGCKYLKYHCKSNIFYNTGCFIFKLIPIEI